MCDLQILNFHQQNMKPSLPLIIILILCCDLGYSQGKLEKAEESLSKKEDRRARGSNRSRSSYSDYSDSGDNFLVAELGYLFAELCLYTTYYTIIETPIEREYRGSRASITKYPYFNAHKGNYSYEWGDDTEVFRTTISNRFIAENSQLYGNHFNIDTKFLNRIGLEVDYLQLWEENTNFGNNALAIFTAMAKYHRIRTERFNAWWGLGTVYVAGEVEEFGFAYGLGAELFFTKPFSIETNFYGSFINQRSVNKFTALLNYHYQRYKFSGGYEHLKIGSADFSTFSVGIGVSF